LRRNATLIVVIVLLAGSAAAFAVAEHLKLEKSPVAGPRIDKVFSPVCDCPQRHATIGFRLRRSDRLTLSLLDQEGHEIRRLVDHVRTARGRHAYFWNGRDKSNELVPEGSYRPKVELGNADRTIVLPNPIRVDLTPPTIKALSVRPRVISPDGDGRKDVTRVRYRATERVRAILLVNGIRKVSSRSRRPAGQLEWLAKNEPPGRYRLALEAEDLAGNLSRRVPAGVVEIRYLELQTPIPPTQPRARVRVALSTDAGDVHWLLRKGSSVVDSGSARGTIRLRAPERPGRYVLVARAGRHEARATLVVRKA
jgi:flagellar hook capping protein FlgD